MRQICWLHISDIHMRVSEAWSHDVVLRVMCEDIARQRGEGTPADFILATGDLAFSGKADEYRLAAEFFDALSAASAVPKGRIFCIPGNHDVDRDRQKMCFEGARHVLQDMSHVDSFLTPGEDFETLLKRQENYRSFLESCFRGQDRVWTPEGLGYVSCVVVDDVRLVIVGLNSAWLAEGGLSDHGKLLLGERQVVDALALAARLDPHVVIAMAHHPLRLLQEFDRGPVQRRIEDACHFFHCGHLHEPETRHVDHAGPDCLTIAAGASFETRQSHNSYSIITLDLLRAKRTIRTIQYNPRGGAFSFSASEEYPINIAPAGTCGVRELAVTLAAYQPSLSQYAHYLAALLLEAKSDIPIPAEKGFAFGSFAVLQAQPDGELKNRTVGFKAFSNVIRVFYGRMPLADIVARYGEPVTRYAAILQEIAGSWPDLKARLADQEKDSRVLAEAEPRKGFSHTGALLAELAAAHDWELLREQAARHLESSDRTVAIQARRMLALGLAQSEEASDRAEAIELYRSLAAAGLAEAADVGNLTTLLVDAKSFEEAKIVLLDGLAKFGAAAPGGLFEIGQRIVETTGDRKFRKELEAAIAARGKT